MEKAAANKKGNDEENSAGKVSPATEFYETILENYRSLTVWRKMQIEWNAFYLQYNLSWSEIPEPVYLLLDGYRHQPSPFQRLVFPNTGPIRLNLDRYDKLMGSEDGEEDVKEGFRHLQNRRFPHKRHAYVVLIALLENKTVKQVLDVCLGSCECGYKERIIRNEFFDGDYEANAMAAAQLFTVINH